MKYSNFIFCETSGASVESVAWEEISGFIPKLNNAEFSAKLSYNLLESEEIQQTFLIYACMGQDALISDLVRYCISLGLLQGIDTVREARDRVHKLVARLKELSLLSESFSSRCFTMQSLIRDAALLIASKRCLSSKIEAKVQKRLKALGNATIMESKLEQSNKFIGHRFGSLDCYNKVLSLEKLKILYITNQDIEKLWHCNCPLRSFCELENLTLSTNRKMLNVITSSMIERFNKLEKLTLHKCELLAEVFNLEDDKIKHIIQEMFPQLKKLVLSDLRKLECVWNKEPQALKLHFHCHYSEQLIEFINNPFQLFNMPEKVFISSFGVEDHYIWSLGDFRSKPTKKISCVTHLSRAQFLASVRVCFGCNDA
ncbi:hypothetical protein Fmac_027076 [Flemingia macrophylla]|uniref:Disease resistance protein At4g27190-like leucine-rich repeats domain-containing protein n=1 Tax=Flemingia macrophylla TaxID=520843 RepID=A0ABD1LGV0_9FABA